MRSVLVVLLCLVALLPGCMNLGTWLSWQEKIVDEPYQKVYRTVYSKVGCTMFTPRGNLYTDIKEGEIIVYMSGIIGVKEYGTVTVKALDDNTTLVKAGALPWMVNLDKQLLRLTENNVQCPN